MKDRPPSENRRELFLSHIHPNALLFQRTFLGTKDDDADELLGVGEKGGEREVLLHYARNVLLDGGHSVEDGVGWKWRRFLSLHVYRDAQKTGP